MLGMKYWGAIVDFYVESKQIPQFLKRYKFPAFHFHLVYIIFMPLLRLVMGVFLTENLWCCWMFFSDKGKHSSWTSLHCTYLKLQVDTFNYHSNVFDGNGVMFISPWWWFSSFNRKNKNTFWNLLHISPVRNATGKVFCMCKLLSYLSYFHCLISW